MNNDMKLYFPTNFGDDKGTGDGNSMRSALCLIAKEIQRFRFESEGTKHKNDEDIDILVKKNNTDAANLETKNKQVKTLKERLKTVCNVAKIVLSAKNKETDHLMNRLNDIRNKSSELSRSNAESLGMIQKLRMENYNINNDVQILCNFIHMAYRKLQKMRKEVPKEMPFIEELKTIMLACGQYYADCCNSRDRCTQLERQNRFLKNKLSIVENNLAATTEELRNLKIQNVKLRVKYERNRNADACSNKLSPNYSEMSIDTFLDESNQVGTPKVEYKRNLNIANKSLSLNSHLETVRNLLLDQDNMLKELKDLYLEVDTKNRRDKK